MNVLIVEIKPFYLFHVLIFHSSTHYVVSVGVVL
jgi:hypothetical protein